MSPSRSGEGRLLRAAGAAQKVGRESCACGSGEKHKRYDGRAA